MTRAPSHLDTSQIQALSYMGQVDYWKERAAEARAEALEEAAKLCADFSWGADINWWLSATKKDVSAKTCLECAAAIRALSPPEPKQ